MTRATSMAAKSAAAAASGASSPSPTSLSRILSQIRTHLVFGANTDVGKTVITAGLLRSGIHRRNDDGSSARSTSGTASAGLSSSTCSSAVHYIKPLQCGGSDEAFVDRHANLAAAASSSVSLSSSSSHYTSQTLFRWETAASPHLTSRLEHRPVSDTQVLASLRGALASLSLHRETTSCNDDGMSREDMALIETAGGVLSPSSASPDNDASLHARGGGGDKSAPSSWGWTTQADLYRDLGLSVPTILVGDGRLGGISCTLSALESLTSRGYDIHGIVLVDDGGGYDNVTALREYASRRPVDVSTFLRLQHFRTDPARSIVSLPPLPAQPEPLDGWYQSSEVEETLGALDEWLEDKWVEDGRSGEETQMMV